MHCTEILRFEIETVESKYDLINRRFYVFNVACGIYFICETFLYCDSSF